ncbi:MAG: helix-hairpin-helix domain-containing protein [Phycisphaerae bacterium]|nr:helix-hairpin-helix domain-containing protein [Phycisphaerae bacterium]
MLGVLLVYALVVRWFRPVVLEDPIQVEPARVAQIQQQIDPNVATWAELARLPGIGEALAKRIVTYRSEQQALIAGSGGDAAVVFRSPEDLAAVRGIGPKTVERLRPHLHFPAAVSP